MSAAPRPKSGMVVINGGQPPHLSAHPEMADAHIIFLDDDVATLRQNYEDFNKRR